VADFYHQLPKAELHLHLEGSIDPKTLQELDPEADFDACYRFEGFLEFLQCFKRINERLRSPEAYALAARRLFERLVEQNVRYAEVTLSAGVILWKQQEFAPIYEAVRSEAARAQLEVWWILDAIRHFGAEHAMRVAELAAERTGEGVIGFGIGGDEARGPEEWFGEVFRFARDHGLRLTAHAGETTGPESVRGALRIGAERIGHGIRAVDAPALLDELRDRDIPLEICISSNVATGVVPSIEEHPVRRLYDAGVPIVLNTDDPGLFRTTLCREYEIAATRFGFSETELTQLAENSFKYGFRLVG
jgi:adenosine deaminase/aminodeoxyfutalosine deaminase